MKIVYLLVSLFLFARTASLYRTEEFHLPNSAEIKTIDDLYVEFGLSSPKYPMFLEYSAPAVGIIRSIIKNTFDFYLHFYKTHIGNDENDPEIGIDVQNSQYLTEYLDKLEIFKKVLSRHKKVCPCTDLSLSFEKNSNVSDHSDKVDNNCCHSLKELLKTIGLINVILIDQCKIDSKNYFPNWSQINLCLMQRMLPKLIATKMAMSLLERYPDCFTENNECAKYSNEVSEDENTSDDNKDEDEENEDNNSDVEDTQKTVNMLNTGNVIDEITSSPLSSAEEGKTFDKDQNKNELSSNESNLTFSGYSESDVKIIFKALIFVAIHDFTNLQSTPYKIFGELQFYYQLSAMNPVVYINEKFTFLSALQEIPIVAAGFHSSSLYVRLVEIFSQWQIMLRDEIEFGISLQLVFSWAMMSQPMWKHLTSLMRYGSERNLALFEDLLREINRDSKTYKNNHEKAAIFVDQINISQNFLNWIENVMKEVEKIKTLIHNYEKLKKQVSLHEKGFIKSEIEFYETKILFLQHSREIWGRGNKLIPELLVYTDLKTSESIPKFMKKMHFLLLLANFANKPTTDLRNSVSKAVTLCQQQLTELKIQILQKVPPPTSEDVVDEYWFYILLTQIEEKNLEETKTRVIDSFLQFRELLVGIEMLHNL